MNQEVADMIVTTFAPTARARVAQEFGCDETMVRFMIEDPNGFYEEDPEYDRYYEILDEFLTIAEHA